MKCFIPYQERLIKNSLAESDSLVPYQVGMVCFEWALIDPKDDDQAIGSTPVPYDSANSANFNQDKTERRRC